MKRLYGDLAVESELVLSLVTQVTGVDAEAGRVRHLICTAKSGLFTIAVNCPNRRREESNARIEEFVSYHYDTLAPH